jgi:hypothetical protein
MAVFVGHKGNIRLRRGLKIAGGFIRDEIGPDDVNTSLNRLSFDGAIDNLLTGDRVEIETEDPRKLLCFPPSTWSDDLLNSEISLYVNVNAVGGLRFFRTFEDAVNNVRANEVPLASFTGDPLPIEARVRDSAYNVLGNVSGYTFNTDREAIDTTTLTDKFRNQYTAGLISGNGTIECLFDYETSGAKELPLLMLQLIQRLDIGSEFDLALYLTDNSLNPAVSSVYYEIGAAVTRAGITVQDNEIVACEIDFVSTGEIKLLVGEPSGYVLKEDDGLIELEQSLDFLLTEVED